MIGSASEPGLVFPINGVQMSEQLALYLDLYVCREYKLWRIQTKEYPRDGKVYTEDKGGTTTHKESPQSADMDREG